MKIFTIILSILLTYAALGQSVSENEKLVDQSIANQGSIIESLQATQKRIDSLDAESKKLTKSKKKVLEPCGEGKYRNPDTNRCKKEKVIE